MFRNSSQYKQRVPGRTGGRRNVTSSSRGSRTRPMTSSYSKIKSPPSNRARRDDRYAEEYSPGHSRSQRSVRSRYNRDRDSYDQRASSTNPEARNDRGNYYEHGSVSQHQHRGFYPRRTNNHATAYGGHHHDYGTPSQHQQHGFQRSGTNNHATAYDGHHHDYGTPSHHPYRGTYHDETSRFEDTRPQQFTQSSLQQLLEDCAPVLPCADPPVENENWIDECFEILNFLDRTETGLFIET